MAQLDRIRFPGVLRVLSIWALAVSAPSAWLGGCAAPYVAPVVEKPSGPLTLEAAVDLAIKNNPDLDIAEGRVAEARAAIEVALSQYWPTLQFAEGFTAVDKPSQAFGYLLDQNRTDEVFGPGGLEDPGITSNWRTGLLGSLTLYDGGRRQARFRAREAEAGSAAARAEEVKRDIALEVARAYYSVHKARETAATDEQSIETLVRHLGITEARAAAGAARKSDVLAVRVRLAETREAAIVARNSAERALSGLRVLLGLDLADRLDLEAPKEDDPGPRESLETLVQRARLYRFELYAAAEMVRASEARIREAYAGFHPELTIFGTFGFDDEDPFAFKYGNWTWGFGFLSSLVDIARAPLHVRQATASRASAYAALRKAILEVELDVKNAVLDGDEADARHEVAAQAVELAAEDLRLVEAEYKEGAATITRLLEAELDLTQARTRLSAMTHDRALSRIAIAHAVGEYPAPPLPPEASRGVGEEGTAAGGPEPGPPAEGTADRVPAQQQSGTNTERENKP